MQRKPIAAYCKQAVPGWKELPSRIVAQPGEEEFSCTFLNEELGVHMMSTVKDFGVLHVLHLSVGPIKSCDPTLSDEDWQSRIFANVSDIAESFFPGRQFARQPDDPRRPDVKHYFAVLGVDE